MPALSAAPLPTAELAAAGAGAAAFVAAAAAAHVRAADELRVVRRLVVALRATLLAVAAASVWLLADEWGAATRAISVWQLGPVRPAALLAAWLPMWHAPWHASMRWLASGVLLATLVAGVVASQAAAARAACIAAGTCLTRGGPTLEAALVARGRELALVGLAAAALLLVAHLCLALGCTANKCAPHLLARRGII